MRAIKSLDTYALHVDALTHGTGTHFSHRFREPTAGSRLWFAERTRRRLRSSAETEIDTRRLALRIRRAGQGRKRWGAGDIGTYAGQIDTPWSRRLKIPFRDITWDVVKQVVRGEHVLETHVPGTGKDGGPTCATVKPFAGWKVASLRTSA